ncbi:MAG: hypothetical protein ACOX8V_06895 [Thermoleophilia bacterium]|jgi:hypothetical protein
MPSRRKIRAALRKVCSQHLWMAVPKDLEDEIVDEATGHIADEDIDASPYGPLFELAVFITHDYHGYGRFATVYDDEATVLPIAHPEAFDDGELGTYRVI